MQRQPRTFCAAASSHISGSHIKLHLSSARTTTDGATMDGTLLRLAHVEVPRTPMTRRTVLHRLAVFSVMDKMTGVRCAVGASAAKPLG